MKRQQVPQELHGLRPTGTYSFDELYRLAQACHASGLFEDTKDAAQALVKILRGQEMGLPPTTAMTAFDIIQKRLFVKPWVLAAKINHCGYGAYRVLVQTEQECVIEFRRKYPDLGWCALDPERYTLEEAKAHGLVNRSAHWKASPAHMLYQRCMGRGAMRHFPELAGGLTLPLEETPPPSDAQAHATISEVWGRAPGVRATPDAWGPRAPQEDPLRLPQEPEAPAPRHVADWRTLPDDGWRQALSTLLAHLPEDDLWPAGATQALHDPTTPLGHGVHLVEEASKLAAQQTLAPPEECPPAQGVHAP